MSDQVGNQNVGFLMTRLICSPKYALWTSPCVSIGRGLFRYKGCRLVFFFHVYYSFHIGPYEQTVAELGVQRLPMSQKWHFRLIRVNMSLVVRKPAFYICENKDADQLRGNREADQRLCFCFLESTIPLLPKYEISSLYPPSVVVQPGLCRTWSETPKTGFLATRLIS